MVAVFVETRPIQSEEDVAAVRLAVRKAARDVSISTVNETKIVTAASEIARNCLIYGGGGSAIIERVDSASRLGIRITIKDKGPGISDLEQAFRDGFTSGKGMGLGLGGAKRLSDEFEIDTAAGSGTTVTMTKWK